MKKNFSSDSLVTNERYVSLIFSVIRSSIANSEGHYRSNVLPEQYAVSIAITTTAGLYVMYCNKQGLTLLGGKRFI